MNNADDQREEKQTLSQGDDGTKVEKALNSPKNRKYRLYTENGESHGMVKHIDDALLVRFSW